MDNTLVQPYRNLLLKLLKKDYPESSNYTVIFSALKGKLYEDNRELMLIGRATNGWRDCFYQNKEGLSIENEIEKTIKSLNDHKDLTADIATWFKKNTKLYNIGGSQFWRVGLRITETIVKTNRERTDYIVYSNLYKAAPDGTNPSEQMKKVTEENCIEILKAEIDAFQPKRILMLTGYDWAEPFIKGLGIEGIPNRAGREVQFVGIYGNTKIVVAVHPQGKNETKISDAIRTAFGLPIPVRK